jgi:23S rRNA (cytosine1962-C5)-methyltransferase
LIRLDLKPGRDASVRRRHPWLFSGAVARTQGDPSDGIAEVFSSQGERVGAGAFSPDSQIIARLWVFGSDPPPGRALFDERFEAARRLRSGVLPPQTTGFRGVHSEGDLCPGVVLDVYAGTGVLELSTEGTERWEDDLAAAARKAFHLERLVIRRSGAVRDRGGDPRGRDAARDSDPVSAGDASGRAAFTENGLKFIADFSLGQKSGFFLDQRDNRSRARMLASGRRVLNLFSYSGGFSVAALAGGAARAVDVDSSAPALELAAEHRRENGLAADPADFIRADVFSDLRARAAAGEEWDLVILDPPAFAKRKSDVDAAARGYKDVNRLAMKLVAPGGLLLTCSCSGLVDPTLFQQIVFAAELESGGAFSLLARQGAGPDHPVSLDCPEGEYLKGLWLTRSR